MAEALTDAELDFLRSVLDLARAGDTAGPAEAVDAGVPVNLASGAGDSLVILATYHDHPETVRALLAAGVDPALGGRSALDIARSSNSRRCWTRSPRTGDTTEGSNRSTRLFPDPWTRTPPRRRSPALVVV
ncbi:ankyrin repeat domain-containing protein [Umezawaea sp. NPDC059074]|uniref:ankyrin repeat domain-containing protein n=1 Tax=Umezawaea sp. NPDC059074 TaxID=3346716 RepID=UPI003686906D